MSYLISQSQSTNRIKSPNTFIRGYYYGIFHSLDYTSEFKLSYLSTKSVQSTSLPLEGVDHIHGGNSLPLGVLSVGDSIPDDVLEEDL